ncbi:MULTISPECIES: hypothetical protein [Winogradskyella]|uniref:SpoIIAA-like protein n=2 Tax=Winogradskyella TaxID=286104 RepID=A0A368ZJI8_9FLAO|nr:hypothetical protein [Winogradskyella arenosi]RCW92797.1 hypothetical protein DFQ08_102833 [Winogradskyella arenosi]
MNYNPKISPKPYKSYHLSIGKVFLYENFIVTEFNEGVEMNFESFNEISEIILLSYRNKPFGFIANRTNAYAIKLKDVLACKKSYQNLKAYAIIAYSDLTENIIEIEDHFFNFNRKVFTDFSNAIQWVEEVLETEPSPILS